MPLRSCCFGGADVANLLLGTGAKSGVRIWPCKRPWARGRLRLAGTIVSESLVLSFLAGIVGFAATWASLRALVAMAQEGCRVDAIHMDGGVALFCNGAFTRDDDPFSVGSGVRGGTHRSRHTFRAAAVQ